MKRACVIGLGLLFVAGIGVVPRLFSAPAGVPHPYSLWPASDAAFDLGIAGPLDTAYRWRNLWLASVAMINATIPASAAAGELVFGARTEGTSPAGSGYAKLFFRVGGNPGTCKLVAVGGTSVTETVIADNIGGGGCGGK